MEKNIEVELRALVKDAKDFQEKLKEKGAIYQHSSYLCDVYFCEKNASSVEDVEMDEVGSYSLRLRVARKDDKEKITVNTKTITNQGDHNAWEEHEVVVDSFKETAKILLITEFKPFFKLEKHRHTYAINGIEVLVEDITDFGGAIEVEIMCAPGEENESKEKIKNLLITDLGLSESDIVPKSVTNIIMKQRAFNQEITF
jgi:predicted adenylyl cyclase CyaB